MRSQKRCVGKIGQSLVASPNIWQWATGIKNAGVKDARDVGGRNQGLRYCATRTFVRIEEDNRG